jgi:hypothetical protein
MLGWACKREDRKRRSIARCERASISMSASHSNLVSNSYYEVNPTQGNSTDYIRLSGTSMATW